MKWLRRIALVFLTGVLLFALALILWLKYPTPVPDFPASPFAPRAKMDSLPRLSIQILATGDSPSPLALVEQGGSLLDTVHLVHPAILIQHPKGLVLWESGLGSKLDEQMKAAGWLVKLFPLHRGVALGDQTAVRQLKTPIAFALISHVHWDHVSGLGDLPGVKLRLAPEEIRFAFESPDPGKHGIFPALMASLKGQIEPLVLKNIPYENFSSSLDLFGDQSLVVVPLPGHTPGSIGLFVNLPEGKRFLLIGDASWLTDAQGQPVPRSRLGEAMSDHDPVQARITRQKLRELLAHSNEVVLVPTHDAKALGKLMVP